MSKASTVKQCEIFSRRCETNTKMTLPSPSSNTDANMASIAKILNKLKSPGLTLEQS